MITLSEKKTSSFICLSMLGVASIFSLQVQASDAIGPGDSDSKWVVGAAIGAYNNPYVGEDNTAVFSPTIRYNGERFFVQDGSLNLHLAKSTGFSGGLKVALDGGFLSDIDDFKDNEKLAGLTEREATVLGGFYLNHDSELGRLSFNALTDIGNEHDGHVAELKYTFDFNAGNWNINPELGAQWASADYVDHYVGVSESEATNTRLQFRGEDSMTMFAGVRARYDLTENWDVDLRTGVSKLGSEISDSSIINDDVVYGASVGINYNF